MENNNNTPQKNSASSKVKYDGGLALPAMRRAATTAPERSAAPSRRPGLALPPAPPASTTDYSTVAAPAVATAAPERSAASSRTPGLALPPAPPTTMIDYSTVVAPAALKTEAERSAIPAASTTSANSGPEILKSTQSSSSSSKKRKHGDEASEQEPKKRIVVCKYRCRYGCAQLLIDGNGLRVHMHKVHNLFKSPPAYSCSRCNKLYATQKELDAHDKGQDKKLTFCINWGNHPAEWNVAQPRTEQEKADTWVYKEDGPVSIAAIVWLDSYGNEVPYEEPPCLQVAQNTAGSSSAKPILLNDQLQSTPSKSGRSQQDPIVLDDQLQRSRVDSGFSQQDPMVLDDHLQSESSKSGSSQNEPIVLD